MYDVRFMKYVELINKLMLFELHDKFAFVLFPIC